MSNQNIAVTDVHFYIHFIRGKKVILDEDLSQIYGVSTGSLNRAVKRNPERLPQDFMFRLTNQEVTNLICQSGISSFEKYGGRRTLPYAFTQEGVAMLSSVLRSPRAIQSNIEIMRAFVKMREFILENKELTLKIEQLELKYDGQFKIVFDAIKGLIAEKNVPRKKLTPPWI